MTENETKISLAVMIALCFIAAVGILANKNSSLKKVDKIDLKERNTRFETTGTIQIKDRYAIVKTYIPNVEYRDGKIVVLGTLTRYDTLYTGAETFSPPQVIENQ